MIDVFARYSVKVLLQELTVGQKTTMQSIKIRSHIGPDGILHLDVPVGVHDADLEVTVTVQPVDSTPQGKGWPLGFFEETFGSFKDNPLMIDSEGVLEEEDELHL